MRNLLNLLVDIVAVVRLTRLINQDVITEPLRDLVWSKFPPNTKIGYLLTCPWCMSIWAGLSITLLRRYLPGVADIVNTTLAASQVTGILANKGW